MRKRLVAVLTALSLLGVTFAFASAPKAEAYGWGEPRFPFCYVEKNRPTVERTIQATWGEAANHIRRTASYYGPCAEYGQSATLGKGKMTAYSQENYGVPVSVGLVLTKEALQGLTYDPPNAGLWCFDKNGDGTVDRMHECAGGHETALQLGKRFQTRIQSPFSYVLMNWNPMGHIPEGIYDVPHFDVHFYMNNNAERLAIRPGPCTVLVNCDDYKLGKKLPAAKYYPSTYADLDAVEPAMGNHLLDTTAPELRGGKFTHTFIYGVWNSKITFYEPMVNLTTFEGLRDGKIQNGCFPIKQPRAWQKTGWYPTSYCLESRANRGEVVISLQHFAYRRAS